jgi:hypothetical protein
VQLGQFTCNRAPHLQHSFATASDKAPRAFFTLRPLTMFVHTNQRMNTMTRLGHTTLENVVHSFIHTHAMKPEIRTVWEQLFSMFTHDSVYHYNDTHCAHIQLLRMFIHSTSTHGSGTNLMYTERLCSQLAATVLLCALPPYSQALCRECLLI